MPSNHFQQYGFDVEITIGSYLIDTTQGYHENGLCDEMRVTATEGGARTATFSFIPPEDTIDLQQFQGNKVKIRQRINSGWFQIFDGWVDIPSIEFMTGKITLECSDRRQTQIENLSLTTVQSVGSYSEAVFGVSKNVAEELDKRLQTVAGSFDFDGYGNYHLTAWLPKASADFTLTPADIQYNSNPQLSYSNRDKTINTVNISIQYKYQRLHQQACNFSWPGFQDFIKDYWEQGRPSFPSRETITSAVTKSDWKLVNAVTLVPLWSAQGFPSGDGFIMWQPDQVIEETKQREVFDGYLKAGSNFVTQGTPPMLVPSYKKVFDVFNKPVMDVIKTTIIDNSSKVCRGASWTSAIRFAQTVTEQYHIVMEAPQGSRINGVISDSVTISLDDPYDTSTWESTKAISGTATNFYINQKLNYSKVYSAIQVCLNKARHDILSAHRDTTLTFKTVNQKPRPEIDLQHTVDVTIDQLSVGRTKSIHAKGKVSAITHIVDFSKPIAYSNISLKLSRSQGSASNSIWSVLQPLEDSSYIGQTNTVVMNTNISLDPSINPTVYSKKTGWFCNAFPTNSDGSLGNKTTFPEQFVVDFPQIPTMLRNEITYYSEDNNFDLVIPNDVLEVHT